jgi:hypothetical protein
MPSRATFDAFTSDEFIGGLGFGLGAVVVGILAIYMWRQWRDDVMPVAGLLMAAAGAVAVEFTLDPPNELVVGLVLLLVAGALDPVARRVPLLPAALAVPGAWWVTQRIDLPGADWVTWLLFGWVVVAAPLTASADRHLATRGFGPTFLVVAVAAMFTTLPDTEEILVVFGAVVALALLAWPKVFASLGAVGIYPAVGLLVWVIAVGGRGRESAVVGAVACIGVLAIEPLVRWFNGRTILDAIPATWWRPFAAVAFQLLVAVPAARIAGLRDTAVEAAIVTIVIVAATMIGLTVDRVFPDPDAIRSRTEAIQRIRGLGVSPRPKRDE